MAFSFEKLLVDQNSVDFADAACASTRRFPRGYFFLADRLSRAALAIATNLAEGIGRLTVADRRNFSGWRSRLTKFEPARRRDVSLFVGESPVVIRTFAPNRVRIAVVVDGRAQLAASGREGYRPCAERGGPTFRGPGGPPIFADMADFTVREGQYLAFIDSYRRLHAAADGRER